MHGLSAIDPGSTVDWGKTSADYAAHRPGPPESFYERLRALGVGLPGQRILDLGTGTGVLARAFAARGARVAGVDVAEEQVAMARALGGAAGLTLDLRTSPAEATPFPDASFDVLTANQCWLYFDRERAIAEARRLLVPGGTLVTSHFSWLPRKDPVAAASEALILEHNPRWTAAGWSGVIPACPSWAAPRLRVRAMFFYDEPVPFTREGWRGRIRASRGIGASLAPDAIARFDEAHARLLERIAPERFTVLHRIDAHLLVFEEDV